MIDRHKNTEPNVKKQNSVLLLWHFLSTKRWDTTMTSTDSSNIISTRTNKTAKVCFKWLRSWYSEWFGLRSSGRISHRCSIQEVQVRTQFTESTDVCINATTDNQPVKGPPALFGRTAVLRRSPVHPHVVHCYDAWARTWSVCMSVRMSWVHLRCSPAVVGVWELLEQTASAASSALKSQWTARAPDYSRLPGRELAHSACVSVCHAVYVSTAWESSTIKGDGDKVLLVIHIKEWCVKVSDLCLFVWLRQWLLLFQWKKKSIHTNPWIVTPWCQQQKNWTRDPYSQRVVDYCISALWPEPPRSAYYCIMQRLGSGTGRARRGCCHLSSNTVRGRTQVWVSAEA